MSAQQVRHSSFVHENTLQSQIFTSETKANHPSQQYQFVLYHLWK